MTPQSAKAKGRKLQQWVRAMILSEYPTLNELDVRSTSMGAGGVDVQLSTAALYKFPYKVEAKNLARASVYSLYEQACSHKCSGEPLLVLKANNKRPLVVLDATYFFTALRPRQELYCIG